MKPISLNPFLRAPRVLAACAAAGALMLTHAETPQTTGVQARAAAEEESRPAADDRAQATIRGRIQGFRHLRAGDRQSAGTQAGDRYTLAKVRLEDGRAVVVALGPKSDLDRLGLRKSVQLTVHGHAGIVDGIPALVAERIEVNGERLAIRPSEPPAERQASDRRPSAAQERSAPAMDANTRELLDKVRNAYQQVKSLYLAGTFATDLEVDAVTVKTKVAFTSSYQAPNRFRHETADLLIGADGKDAFVFNKKTNHYLKTPLEGNRGLAETLPASTVELLHKQNPSLLGAMMQHSFERVLNAAEQIEKLDDGVIEDRAFPQLVLRGLPNHGPISVLIDPQTHLARRVTVDMRRVLDRASAAERTRRARAVVDYSVIDTQPDFAGDQFVWQAPVEAGDVAQREEEDETGLVGKQAPDFTLPTLDNRTVSLHDLAGKVVVVDFWGAWCPPCTESLPRLDRVYRDQNKENVAFFAIHLGDDKEQIHAFLQGRKLTIPVLIDADGAVARAYQVRGIPKTVVIGRDGKVSRAFTGLGGDRYDRIRDAIREGVAAPRARDGAPGTKAPGHEPVAQSQPRGSTTPARDESEGRAETRRQVGSENAPGPLPEPGAGKPADVRPPTQAPEAGQSEPVPAPEERLRQPQSPSVPADGQDALGERCD